MEQGGVPHRHMRLQYSSVLKTNISIYLYIFLYLCLYTLVQEYDCTCHASLRNRVWIPRYPHKRWMGLGTCLSFQPKESKTGDLQNKLAGKTSHVTSSGFDWETLPQWMKWKRMVPEINLGPPHA